MDHLSSRQTGHVHLSLTPQRMSTCVTIAMKEMHLIMIVYIDCAEHITKLERLVIAFKVPYIIVRKKIETVSEAEAKKNLSRAELVKKIYG